MGLALGRVVAFWWGRLVYMHSMHDLSLTTHVHGVVGHVHWSSHCGIELSCGLECWLLALISV